MLEKPWQEILRELSWLPNHETVTKEKISKIRNRLKTKRLREKSLFGHLQPPEAQETTASDAVSSTMS